MSIELKEVQRIATLARLRLSEAQTQNMAHDLASILDYVHRLSTIDTRHIEATSHAVALPTKFRDDVVQPGLSAEQTLNNAPERLGDGFGVPKIIE